jgi:hypothetical protein
MAVGFMALAQQSIKMADMQVCKVRKLVLTLNRRAFFFNELSLTKLYTMFKQ